MSWEDITIHVVALQIDPDNAALTRRARPPSAAAATRARGGWPSRWRQPASPAPTKARCRYVTSERLISRTHFARFLVEAGHATETKDVFKRYLTPGKPGYVAHAWATPRRRRSTGSTRPAARPWSRIRAATRSPPTGMRRLLGEFRDRRRRWHRGAVVVAHAGAVRGIRDATRAVSACSHPAAPTITDPARAGSTWATCRRCPSGVAPVWKRLVDRSARRAARTHAHSPHRLLRLRPHRHHRRDARQQPADAVRGHRVPPA